MPEAQTWQNVKIFKWWANVCVRAIFMLRKWFYVDICRMTRQRRVLVVLCRIASRRFKWIFGPQKTFCYLPLAENCNHFSFVPSFPVDTASLWQTSARPRRQFKIEKALSTSTTTIKSWTVCCSRWNGHASVPFVRNVVNYTSFAWEQNEVSEKDVDTSALSFRTFSLPRCHRRHRHSHHRQCVTAKCQQAATFPNYYLTHFEQFPHATRFGFDLPKRRKKMQRIFSITS